MTDITAKLADSLATHLETLPAPATKNILESDARGESMTADAFRAGFLAGQHTEAQAGGTDDAMREELSLAEAIETLRLAATALDYVVNCITGDERCVEAFEAVSAALDKAEGYSR